MINLLLTCIINFILILCKIILMPINSLIESALPELSDMLDSIKPVFDYASNYLNYAIALSGLSDLAIKFIVLYFTFKLTVPLTVHVIKFVVKWYNALKP